jgi:hypothetical protein
VIAMVRTREGALASIDLSETIVQSRDVLARSRALCARVDRELASGDHADGCSTGTAQASLLMALRPIDQRSAETLAQIGHVLDQLSKMINRTREVLAESRALSVRIDHALVRLRELPSR